jgi:hypothetical protein
LHSASIDLKELYHLRWGEETYFNFQKNVLEIENFSGISGTEGLTNIYWNGSDDFGITFVSGSYIVVMKGANQQIAAKKIVFLK